MSETEKLKVGFLVSVLVLLAPGSLLHEAPRFPGSLLGSLLGIIGATLFVLLLIYSLVKRSAWVRRRVTQHASLRAILSFHVYTGVIGALFGILHSGHTYQSPLGIGLVSAMLAVVLSGFAGRYYLAQIGTDLREQQARLGTLRTHYDLLAANAPGAVPGRTPAVTSHGSGPAASVLPTPGAGALKLSARELVGSIADLEHDIDRREALERILARWVVLHVAAALVLYPVLALHIWNGIYFGLRWLP